MQEFKVFEHPCGKVELVKQGWSWPAFFFQGLWLFVKRMWGFGVLYVIFICMLALISGIGESLRLYGGQWLSVIAGFAYLIVYVLLGAKGNYLREKDLLSKGFAFRTTVKGLDQEDAAASLLAGDDES